MKKHKNTLFATAYFMLILVITTMATVPPVSRDAQTHHLALPKIWLSEGILAEVPDMDFSYYPQLVDLLYIYPVAINKDILAKYIHFAFALGCVVLIFLYIRRHLGVYWGLLGGLMFLSLPIILKLSVTVYVDLGLLFFFTASLLSALVWLEDTSKLRWLIVSGIGSGLAMSTKYNAMLSVVILVLLVGYFFLILQKNREKNLQLKLVKYVSIFSFCALLIYSPWLIRNYELTKNPIYPLLQSVFSKQNSAYQSEDLTKEGKSLKPLTLRKVLYNEKLIYSLALPFRVFLEGQDNKPQYFDGRLNPLLLFLPLILFFSKKKRWQYQFLASFTVLTLIYTMFATSMRIRYIITIITPMIILSVYGLHELQQVLDRNKPKFTKAILFVLIIIFFSYNISYGVNLFKEINPLPYITGKISRDEYIEQKLPYYSLNKIANKVVSQEHKLLGIYTGNRRYYINVPVSLDSSLIFRMANDVSNTSELVKELEKRRISHILLRVDLLNSELARSNSEIQNMLVDFFTNKVKLLGKADKFALYEINTL